MRSADNCIGVSGFLISCASRLATSPQAESRCACSRAVMSSNTTTKPAGPPSSAGKAVQAHISTRRPTSPLMTICSRQSASPCSRCDCTTSKNCFSMACCSAISISDSPIRSSRLIPRIAPAAWFAVLIRKSGSSDTTPVDKRARIIARLARSVSTACWLWYADSRACASR